MCKPKRAKDKHQQVLLRNGIRHVVSVTGVVINAAGMFGKAFVAGARRRVQYVQGSCFEWMEV